MSKAQEAPPFYWPASWRMPNYTLVCVLPKECYVDDGRFDH